MQHHVNGELVPAEEAAVSVHDRGFAYGDAAVERLRAYGGEVFEWAAHADRLLATLDLLEVDHGLGRDDLRGRVRETLAANDLEDASVRLSVTRGVGPGKLAPAPGTDPTVVVVAGGLPRGGREGTPTWAGPARTRTAGTRRPSEGIPARAKTHSALNGVLARLELRGTAAAEALVLDADGALVGGAASNLFFVFDGALRTPGLEGPVFPGVTRSVVLDLAREEGVPVEPGRYRVGELRAADEAFLTNTAWEVRPVATVDGAEVGGGPVADLLGRAFDDLIERRHY